MKINFLITLLSLILLLSGCSKPVAKTSAKLKLNLSKIVDFTSGVGSGGAILFAKSSTGDQFGKFINSTEVIMDLPNGQWTFYAIMWEKVLANFDGKAVCATSSQSLTGQAVSVSLNLNNANCADPIFSGGDNYLDSGNQRFAKLWLEECDELSGANALTCLKDNQGSAVSYRLVFKNYKIKAGSIDISNEAFFSKCVAVNALYNTGLGVNFPTGNSGMPFVVSVEMFMSSNDCGDTVSEVKGVFTHTFLQGTGVNSVTSKMVKSAATVCMPNLTDKESCESNLGTWSGSVCTSMIYPAVGNFNSTNCYGGSTAISEKHVKQMIAIPKAFLCRFNDTMNTGALSMAGGEGTQIRPYKICNEWQMNQIGEYNSTMNSNFSYKLMNDLDMNKSGIMSYPAPLCAGQDQYDQYLNLNPLDKINCYGSSNAPSYGGVFNGNNKTIANARITTDDKTLDYFGFTRQLAGTVKNLNFSGLEVRAGNFVGGITGGMGGSAIISNVTLDKLEVDAVTKVGGVAGITGASTNISGARILDGEIYAQDEFGGIVGSNDGVVDKSMFRGFVKNDMHSMATTYYSGGIAGVSSGIIKNTFSEGALSSSTDYMGGIVGSSSGAVKIVYSTMALIPTKETGSVVIGGIIGSQSGTLEDCYSDVAIRPYGNATLTKNGVLGSNDGGTFTSASCFTDNKESYTPAIGVSYDNMRAATIPAGATFTYGNGNWIFATKSLPRLAWETDRQCQTAGNVSVAAQIGTLGRGSAINPILICNIYQYNEMDNRSPSLFYKMMEDINAGGYGMGTVSSFYGVFNGNDKTIYGLGLNHNDGSAQNGWGLVTSNYGTIKNLNVVGNHLINTDALDSSFGILAGENYGTISNVTAYGNKIRGETLIGGLVGKNYNNSFILDSTVELTRVLGSFQMGGVVGSNYGVVLKVAADVNVGVYGVNPAIAFGDIGGIAGNNFGSINQTSVRGMINLTEVSIRVPYANIGGIVGDNGRDVLNSYVRPDFSLNVYDGAGVGGVAGVMSSSSSYLENSFMLGRIRFLNSPGDATNTLDTDNTFDERKIGPLVGYLEPGASISGSFYLPHTYMYDYGTLTITACPSSSTATVSAAPATLGGFRKMSSGGGGQLGYFDFTPISGTDISFNSADYVCNIGDMIELGTDLSNYAEHGIEKTPNGFKTLNDFSSVGYFIDNSNSAPVMNYFISLMNGGGVPAGTPIWTLDPLDAKHPKLLQVEH